MKFKIGDKVKSDFYNETKNELGTIVGKSKHKNCWLIDGFNNGAKEGKYRCYARDYLTVVSKKNKRYKDR